MLSSAHSHQPNYDWGRQQRLLQDSVHALQAGQSDLALVLAQRALRASHQHGCIECERWATIQLGRVYLQRAEYDLAAELLSHVQQLAPETSDQAVLTGMDLSHQHGDTLERGASAPQRRTDARAEIESRLAAMEASLQSIVAQVASQPASSRAQSLSPHNPLFNTQSFLLTTPPIDFDIRCLGLFAIYHNDRRIIFPRNRKVERVLKYLVIHRDRPTSRDILMHVGWPEAPSNAAANDLNTTISTLRSSLVKALERQIRSSPILFEDSHYSLNPELILRIDAAEFDAYYQRGLAYERSDQKQQAIADYGAAVALYHGDLLMGDLYDDWTVIERERLASTFLTLLAKLANHCIAEQHYEEAIGYAHRLLEHDPCREDAHHILMRSFARLGQRVQALRQYDLCRVLLQRELEIEPARETVELRNRIARGDAV